MQKVERYSQKKAKIHDRTAAKQRDGTAIESPQTKKIKQFEAMAASSPRRERLINTAKMISTSPAMVERHRLANKTRGSAAAQMRKLQEVVKNSAPLQLVKKKVKNFAGGLLSWDPKTSVDLIRYATQEEYDQFKKDNSYKNVEHKDSIRNAVWFFDPKMPYDASFAEGRPAIASTSLSGLKEKDFIHSESEEFKGEAKHPDLIIVKEDEKGAYGIGRNRLGNVAMKLIKKNKKKF
jgi:hypothetical protein